MSTPREDGYWLPCCVVFVSTAHAQQRDIMTATAMPVSEKEPLVAVSLAENHQTLKLIEQSGGFTLVIASLAQKALAGQVGSTRGEATDKFEHFSIQTLDRVPGRPWVPADAAAWLHCRVESRHSLGHDQLVIGRVVDQADLGKPPLVWRQGQLFGLEPIK